MHRWVHDTAAAIRRTPPRDVVLLTLVVVAGAVSPWLVGSHIAVVVTATAASAALVLARRRWPALAFLGSAPVCAASPLGALIGLVVTAVSAGRRVRPTGRLLLVTAAAVAVATGLGVLLDLDGGPLDLLLLVHGGSSAVLAGLPVLAGALLGGRRPLTRLLRERNEYLERAALLTAANARARERTRIAGEMHDLLGHRLSLISMHAGALEYQTTASAPQLSAQAELLRTTARTALDELRQILVVLGVPGDESGENTELTGTRADVTALVEHSRAAGVDVRLVWRGDDLSAADPRTRRAVHRTVREGLTNVHRHAATAAVVVEVDAGDDRVRVAVVNGPAHAPRALPGTGRGLVGLAERAALLGGTVTAGPEARGFALRLEAPTHPPDVSQLPAPHDPGPETPPPRKADVLTVPRVLAIGCVALAVGLPLLVMIGGLAVLLAVR